MIASLSGRVATRGAETAVLEVGGVGLTVQCTPTTLSGLRVGETATVATSLVVREDSLTLFGFADGDERDVFEQVQAVGGVGPRLALAMLAVHPPDALRRAVAAEDTAALTRVPGIGKKGAQRIVLELREKLAPPEDEGTTATEQETIPVTAAWRPQVVSGLVNLGWSNRDAEAAADAVASEAEDPQADVASLLRSALRKLSRV